MIEEYKKYEKEANKNWNLESFGCPPGTKISFQDFPHDIRHVYKFNDQLVIEAYYEFGYGVTVDKLANLFKPEVEWQIGLWSITDEPWLEDIAHFSKIGKMFSDMYKHAETLSPKKIKKADKAFTSIGVRPVKKFDVSYAL